jgi:hypothetical protein
MPEEYLDHKLECPFCHTIRLRIPKDAQPNTKIVCDDCGQFLGLWGELEDDFAMQGGQHGVFSLNKGKIKRLPDNGT